MYPPFSFNTLKKSWAVVFSGLLLTTASCQKEQNVTPAYSVTSNTDAKIQQEPKAVRKGKHLKFTTRRDFERVIKQLAAVSTDASADVHFEKWEQDHGFTSLRAHRAKKRKQQEQNVGLGTTESALNSFTTTATTDDDFTPVMYETPLAEQEFIEDDVLATLVSPDQTIQIDNITYRLDGETNRVYYTVSDNEAVYEELISENPSSPDILWYSMEQNVFELQEAGIEGTSSVAGKSIGGGSGIGCGSGAPGKKQESGVQYSKDQRLHCKLVYQSVGIYFSIVAKGESQNRFLRVWWPQTSSVTLEPQAPNNCKWLPLCENTWLTDATTYYNWKQPIPNGSQYNQVVKRYYESTKGLKHFDCTVRMYDQAGRISGPTLHIDA